MAFTLETIFSSRPARDSSGSGNRPLSSGGKGEDFAKVRSEFETDTRDQDEPDLPTRTDAGQVAASAILVNSPAEEAGPGTQTPTGAGDTAPASESPEALPEDVLMETPDTPLAADALDRPVGKLEEMAPEKMGASDATIKPLGAVPTDAAAASDTQDTGADAAQLKPSAPEPDEANASARPQVNADRLSEADTVAQPGAVDPARQSALASAPSPVATAATPDTKNAGRMNAIASTSAASTASIPAGDGLPAKGDTPTRTPAQGDFPTIEGDQVASSAKVRNPDTVSETATGAKAVNPLDMAISTQSGLAQSPTSQATAGPVQGAMTPTHSLISATPARVVEIISDTIAAPEDRKDRVHIQLDPPELGRVSIDFKFDANGLQHVTVTGETPEALRQLRAMHFELVNALERQGLSSQNMSFEQHQAQQDSRQQAARTGPADGDIVADTDVAATSLAAARNSQHRSAAAGSLNIKL